LDSDKGGGVKVRFRKARRRRRRAFCLKDISMIKDVAMFDWIVIEPTTVTFLVDLVIAVTLGVLIGGERELRNKDAGISTHTFVICGAMLFTFMSMTVDPASKSRIAAQIVSGIGFLGAGLILKDGTSVRNLTTAASIWFAGAIGMAIGFGYHQIAIIAALASMLIPRIPHVRKEKRVQYKTDDGAEVSPQKLNKNQDDTPPGAPIVDD
jgi:putative Mg2+ transporter-C (MgtC) family protein